MAAGSRAGQSGPAPLRPFYAAEPVMDLRQREQTGSRQTPRLFTAEERARRAAAQAASDALDPFRFDVDLNCEDRPAPRSSAPTSGAGEPT